MFYISRKLGTKYGVIDSTDGVEEFYSMKQLERFLAQGVQILGVAYVHNRLIVNPAVVVDSKSQAAKTKLLKGTCTGYAGFDLKFEDDKVTALPLKETFFDYAKNNTKRDGFVLTVPEGVTHLASNFFKPPANFFNSRGRMFVFFVVLPTTLVEIGSDALSHWSIYTIQFNSTIDVVKSYDLGSSYVNASSLELKCNHLKDNTFHVRSLEKLSLSLTTFKDKKFIIKLPDLIHLDEFSIVTNRFHGRNLVVFLGNNLKSLPDFVVPARRYNSGEGRYLITEKMLVNHAVIVFLDDNTKLNNIDFSTSSHRYSKSDYEMDYNSYIFVTSESLAQRLKPVFDRMSKVLPSQIAVGLITYQNPEGYRWLVDNLDYCCQHYRASFKTHLKLGSFERLILK